MIKLNFRGLSGVLFLTVIFLVFTATIVCAEDQNLMYQYQTKLIGVPKSNTSGEGIAIDSAGNCYITGDTDGNLDGEIKTGEVDAFITKYDANGNKKWTKLLGAAKSSTFGNDIVIDSEGNSYIVGDTTGKLDGQIKIGRGDAFIVKYDTNGNKQWTKLLGAPKSMSYGHGIAIDSAGNFYITGDTSGNLDGEIKIGYPDAFIVKYDANGNKQWTKLLGVIERGTMGADIAIDSADNCYIVGYTNGNLDGQTLTGGNDAFIVKYDTNGNKQWTKLLGAAKSSTFGEGIAIDSAGNCYITGDTSGNLDGEIKTGEVDAFIVKYDTNGNKQ